MSCLDVYARKHDCEACALKTKCCPNSPARKIARAPFMSRSRQGARNRKERGLRCHTPPTSEGRDALHSPEAHTQARSIAPAWPERSERRVPVGRHRQNLRELAKLIPLPAPYSPHEAAQLNFASPAAAAGANSATGTRGFSTLSIVSGSCSQMPFIP